MAYRITDACVKCGACADACPMGIITEGDDKYVIDADQCVDCFTPTPAPMRPLKRPNYCPCRGCLKVRLRQPHPLFYDNGYTLGPHLCTG